MTKLRLLRYCLVLLPLSILTYCIQNPSLTIRLVKEKILTLLFGYRIYALIILILLVVSDLSAQKVFKQNTPSSNCYCEMVFEPTAEDPKAVVVIDVEKADIKTYSRDNPYLALSKKYNILYIKILNQGTTSPLSCYDVVIATIANTDRIHKTAFYVLQKPLSADRPVLKKSYEPTYAFNIIYEEGANINKLKKTLDEATLNRPYTTTAIQTVSEFEAERLKRMTHHMGNKDIGVHLTPLFLMSNKLGLTEGSISPYGLSYAQNITPRSALKLSVNGLFKLPNPSGLQSGLQSKMFTAIQNSEKVIYLDETLSGFFTVDGDLVYKYYFNPKKLFRPYVAGGLGGMLLVNMTGRLQDTLDISNVSLSDPSSLQGLLGGGLGGAAGGGLPDGMTLDQQFYIVPQCELGFDYRLSPMLKTHVAMPIKYHINSSESSLNTLAFGFNFGFSLTINGRKLPKEQAKKGNKKTVKGKNNLP
jgi:hypothetical protein